jgi:superfamily II DNA/RNA helicase
VIFAHSLQSVDQLKARLEKEGHRVVTLTGADSTQDKDKKKLEFNPETGEASADIMIASDAGATGMNLQRGQWEVQMDTPDTAMCHAQRAGRIFRTGQRNDIELADLVAEHPSITKARDRLKRKYGLRELMTSTMEGLDDSGLAWHLKQKFAQQEASNA